MKTVVTAIVPCYNEEAALPYFLREIRKVADAMSATYDLNFEFLFVNDGSKDSTLHILRTAAKEDSRVRYISFSRNFGKEAAMYAGLKNAAGDYVAVMDADMQDPPALLPEMYEALQSGEYDSVATRRVDRKGEPPIRSFFARCFYKIINRISDADIVDGARDFRLMKRQMVDAIVSMGEYNRFSKGIFGWVGFRTKWLPYENVERVAGETKWSFWKLFKYSLQGIVAFSTAPLAIASVVGLVCCIFDDCLYHLQDTDLGRPSGWLAILGLHGHVHGRHPVVLYWYSGAVYCKNLFGDKASSYLHCCRDQWGRRMTKRLLDSTVIKFLMVGVLNTLVGAGTMFLLYNLAGWTYWLSSAANYVVGGIVSFFLNKYFTFQNKGWSWKQVGKFIINVSVCYVLAYGLAKPFALHLLAGQPVRLQENVAMLVGMVLYTGLNYFGQRFFAFKRK